MVTGVYPTRPPGWQRLKAAACWINALGAVDEQGNGIMLVAEI